jgi:hypothetical protein
MTKFIQQGIENPAVVLTKRGFRERLVEAITLDDHPFSFADRKGVKRLLQYLLPRGWLIPSRKTVRRDLDKMHELLTKRITTMMLVS